MRWAVGRMTALALTVGATALLAGGCASRSVEPFEPDANRYQFTFVLSRGSGETGTCAADVSVTDRASKRKIVIPLFTAPWGEATEATANDPTYGARLAATVKISSDGAKGECHAVLYKGETMIASRETSVPVTVSARSSKIKYR